MAEISHEPNFALSSTLDLVSKLDKEKYNWTLKCVDGDIKLEILDRNKSQPPTPKPEANHGNSRTQPSFSRGFAEGQRSGRSRDLSRGARTANLESKIRSANSELKNKSTNLESKVTDKYRSPSELRRSHRRLRAYVHENFSQEKECQTSLETSECPTQASVASCDKQNQTANTFSPPRLESNALKVARNLISRHAETIQRQENNLKAANEEIYFLKLDIEAADRTYLFKEGHIRDLTKEVESLTAKLNQIQPQPVPTSCWNPPCTKTGCSKKCTVCKIAVYCSRACQKTHWKQHKNACVDSN